MLLDSVNGAIEGNLAVELVADDERLIVDRPRQGKLVDETVPDVHDVVASTSVHQHVVLVAREPCIEPIDQALERGTRNQIPALRTEDSNRHLRPRNDVEHFVPNKRREEPVSRAKN